MMSQILGVRSLTNTNLTDAIVQFNFATLWTITKAIYDANPRNESLYHPYDNQSRICLRYDACVQYAGEAYTEYTTQDFWDIISAWRIPLIALIATTPLPALGFSSWIFAIVHMLADPIDTLWSLFYKLSSARRHEEWAIHENRDGIFSLTNQNPRSDINTPQAVAHSDSSSTIAPTDVAQANGSGDPACTSGEEGPARPGVSRSDLTYFGGMGSSKRDQREEAARRSEPEKFKRLDAKALALIINAYDDWHFEDLAKALISDGFRQKKWSYDQRKNFRSSCNAAAALLAADRVAKFTPSVVTSLVFFAQIAASFWKNLYNVGYTPDPSNPDTVNFNRVPHNIAFGVVYFWLPFVIILTAFVGGPQTENSVPRILNIFRADAIQIFQRDINGTVYSDKDIKLRYLEYSLPQRKQRLSTWHLDKFKDWNSEHAKFAIFSVLFSGFIVTIPTAAAIELSWRTPTGGFSCRTTTQILFGVSWIIRFALDLVFIIIFPEKKKGHAGAEEGHGMARSMWIYYISWILDFVLVAGGVIVMTFVSIGFFNDCSCWSQWGTDHGDRYISFPQEQYVFDVIRYRLIWEFSFLVGGALALEAVLFIIVAIYFRKGYRVLRQDDIDKEIAEYGNERLREGTFANIIRARFFAGVKKLFPMRSTGSNEGKGKSRAQRDQDEFELRRPLEHIPTLESGIPKSANTR